MEDTFDDVLGNELDHVSLMFISEHESMLNMGRKMYVWIFCSFTTQISFFVILEICLSTSVIHSKLNLITNIDFVVTFGTEAEHLTINFVCKLVFLVDLF